jgi:hypothetical protein
MGYLKLCARKCDSSMMLNVILKQPVDNGSSERAMIDTQTTLAISLETSLRKVRMNEGRINALSPHALLRAKYFGVLQLAGSPSVVYYQLSTKELPLA